MNENEQQNTSADEQEQQQQQPAPEKKGDESKAEEQQFIKPEDIVAHLDAENAERAAQEPTQEIIVETPISQQHQGLALEYAQDATKIAADMQMPVDTMQSLFSYITDLTMEAVSRDEQAGLSQGQQPGWNLADRQQMETVISRRYGQHAKEITEKAQKQFALLPSDVKAYLDAPNAAGERLSNSPAVISALALLYAGYGNLTPMKAAAELKKVRASKEYMSGDALTKDRVRLLSYMASRGDSADHKGLSAALKSKNAPKPAPSAKAKLEAELRQIRQDPNYYSKAGGHAHKALVARVNEIYEQLHGTGA